jgi:hypothetical protein
LQQFFLFFIGGVAIERVFFPDFWKKKGNLNRRFAEETFCNDVFLFYIGGGGVAIERLFFPNFWKKKGNFKSTIFFRASQQFAKCISTDCK